MLSPQITFSYFRVLRNLSHGTAYLALSVIPRCRVHITLELGPEFHQNLSYVVCPQPVLWETLQCLLHIQPSSPKRITCSLGNGHLCVQESIMCMRTGCVLESIGAQYFLPCYIFPLLCYLRGRQDSICYFHHLKRICIYKNIIHFSSFVMCLQFSKLVVMLTSGKNCSLSFKLTPFWAFMKVG